MTDPAQFRPTDIEAVWGERPVCPIDGLWQWVDPHHILGRGPRDERGAYSSVFNFFPLSRDIHKGPYRDHPLVRRLFLEIARKHVWNAVLGGSYVLNDRDKDFLKLADQWCSEHPC